jgi:cytochrome c553
MKLPASLLLAATLLVAPVISMAQQPAAHGASAAADGAPAKEAAAAEGHAKEAAGKPAKPDLAQGEARYTAVCAACHGADGNSGIPANPKLARQHPEYLVKQLTEFKSGKRSNPIMQGIAAQLSEADMRNIAAWVSSKPAKPGFAKDKELVALGERIWRGGVADRNIAACAGCHSPNGAGIPSQYPRLAGQHADYTTAQLISFREGSRKNSLPMTQVAAKLNDREIRAVSDYVAGLR